MSALGVRRDKAALSSGCKSQPVNAPAGSSRSSYGGDEVVEAFGKRVTKYGDSASSGSPFGRLDRRDGQSRFDYEIKLVKDEG